MDPAPEKKIEVFAPFGAAVDLTKLILFQPFDISKWFVIGFACFLSHLAGGGGGGFNFNRGFGKTNWNFRSTSHEFFQSASGIPGWVIPLVAVGGVLLFALVVLFLWLGARGKFIFTDCVVRNRAAIEEPWTEFKQVANSYFLFSLCLSLIFLFVMALASIPLWLPLVLSHREPEGVGLVIWFVILGLVGVAFAIALLFVHIFMVPVMYRQRCRALVAFKTSLEAISRHPGPTILYGLFVVVLALAFAVASCLLACVTCCITALPYIGTVIMLPIYVFFMSYQLLFVRQFGNEFDAWAGILAVEPTVPTIEPPPLPPPSEPPPMQP